MIRYLFLLLVLPFFVHAQELSKSRQTNWQDAGLVEKIILPKSINAKTLGVLPENTGAINSQKLNDAIIKLSNEGGAVIQFLEGTYIFLETVNMRNNIILKGSGLQTVFHFKLSENKHCINLKGQRLNEQITLKQAAPKGNFELKVDGTLKQGDYIFIYNGKSSLLKDNWVKNHFGQITKVKSVSGSTVVLRDAIRLDYKTNDFIRVIDPIQNSGITNLKIVREGKTKDKTNIINLDYAANCFVNAVECYRTNYAHVNVFRSVDVEISGCYFHHGYSYGSGGKAYGVVLHLSTSNTLVYNNIFEHLRHSMLLQAGANGNVLSYNYSIDPYWKQSFFPNNTAGDMVLHGNYPYLNLFEGNTTQNLVIDGSHGLNGPNNTFFRNRLEFMGATCVSYPFTDHQNFIANEVTDRGFLSGLFLIMGSNHFRQFNRVLDENVDEGTKEPESKSLCGFTSLELFEETPYPNIGVTGQFDKNDTPAKARYKSNNFISIRKMYSVRTEKQQSQKAKEKRRPFWKRWFGKKDKR